MLSPCLAPHYHTLPCPAEYVAHRDGTLACPQTVMHDRVLSYLAFPCGVRWCTQCNPTFPFPAKHTQYQHPTLPFPPAAVLVGVLPGLAASAAAASTPAPPLIAWEPRPAALMVAVASLRTESRSMLATFANRQAAAKHSFYYLCQQTPC
jgi:hypothetical protein